MKSILLTQGKVVRVPDPLFDGLNSVKWRAMRGGKTFYAVRAVGKQRVLMHRVIWESLNGPIPDGLTVDHRDWNGLNNLPNNLRLANRQQQVCNRRKQANNKSGYIGVHWDKARGMWRAKIEGNGKYKMIGRFVDPFSAAWCRDKLIAEYHGEFAVLNNLVDRRQGERRRAA
jgi:hypothetical protein